MPPLPQVTRGFIARYKDQDPSLKNMIVKVSIYPLGCFIAVYHGDELLTYTSRTGPHALSRTTKYVDRIKVGFRYPVEIEEYGIHKVKTDKDGFFISSL